VVTYVSRGSSKRSPTMLKLGMHTRARLVDHGLMGRE
jgi:hypothetical protein